ncbi:MAG: glycerate kinase [Phycisphaerales bacterium]|nr:glycerate kinase [Phycisphaerales bacterium]
MPIRILVAPDSFKESLASPEVADAMALGCLSPAREFPAHHAGKFDTDLCPVGDGGEGTLRALVAAQGLSVRHAAVSGPLGPQERARASWALEGSSGGRAVLELAEVAGLQQLDPGDRNPELTTTHGLGELLVLAASEGVTEVVVGLGGSATVDGGLGALAAMGVVFTDARGKTLQSPLAGRHLGLVAGFEVPPEVRNCWDRIRMRLAVDVPHAPLLGTSGAARVFGPQKGADSAAVARLEEGMASWAEVVGGDPSMNGAGAAGGTAFGLASVLGATIEPGADVVLDAVDFDARCRQADIVLTGEGALDAQSRLGKAPVRVAERAAALGVSVRAVVGRRLDDFGVDAPFDRIGVLEEAVGLETAMAEPAASIAQATRLVLA